ncbi:MAG: FAD-dependent oxidoreductase [Gaiellales bacterium]
MVLGGRREQSLDRLSGAGVDVLVIGGGAIGASTALHAARAGATVAVVDRGDLAGGTSSASSKLVHGGLRYLAMGDLFHVGQAHHERRVHAEVLAPHLVWPLEFVVPVGPTSTHPLWRLRAGVVLYGAMSHFADGRSGGIGIDDARELVPQLRTDGLRGAALYHDHQTHDGRLTLLALQAAAAHGAIVAPHVEVVGLRMSRGRAVGAELADRLGGAGLSVSARVVVNAAGPRVDEVRRMESSRAGTSVRLTKGAHLVLEGGAGWTAAVTTPLPEGRVSFAIPWEGMLLLGTTDSPYEGDPGLVAATDRDQAQILAEAGRSLVDAAVTPERVRSRFAGLRVLPISRRSTSRTRRDVVIGLGPAGMVTVAGGKLTTWRPIGARAARLALREVGVRTRRPPPEPLPGAAPLHEVEHALLDRHPALDPGLLRYLARHYGTVALDVLAHAEQAPELLEPLHPDGPDIAAQVVHAREHEWAATVDDILRTRTTLAFRGLDDPATRARVHERLAVAG